LGATWLQKACDLGSAQACGDLAHLYHTGNGVRQDMAAARRLYEASCREGYNQACQMVRK
jgi:TPR repeat protein